MRFAVKLTISGTVQGVNYRYSAMQQAIRTQVFGWVKNTNTGDVEAYAEGEKNAVESFIAWCKKGPDHAEVTQVKVEEVTPGNFTEFTIIR